MFYKIVNGNLQLMQTHVIADAVEAQSVDALRVIFLNELRSYLREEEIPEKFKRKVKGTVELCAQRFVEGDGPYISIREYKDLTSYWDSNSKELVPNFYLYSKVSLQYLYGELEPLLAAHLKRYPLGPESKKIAVSFLRIAHDHQRLHVRLQEDIDEAVGNAATYVGNGLGKDPERY